MIISRTPHRISFFGGGSDYPLWYRKYGGKVIGTTIDKYCYITCRELPPFFVHKHKIVYSNIEAVKSIAEIQHPSVRETLLYFIRELKLFDESIGFEIHHEGDIPARSGMGSSSSFTVGLVKSIYALAGKIISKEELFRMAIHIEQNLIKESVGSQDQVWAATGGVNKIEFLENGAITTTPVIMSENRLRSLEKRLMLFFTGISRNASVVAEEKIKNLLARKEEIFRMMEMVDEAYDILTSDSRNLNDFGKLLHEAWILKKGLSPKVTNSFIDSIYDTAIKNGAIGGKLLGAGGGGFIVLYVEPENQEKIKVALEGFLHIPFRFDFSGSEIVFYNSGY